MPQDEAGQSKKRQYAQAREGQSSLVVALVLKKGVAFVISEGIALAACPGEIRAERDGDAGERRVHQVIGVRTAVEPFHTSGKMCALIAGLAEHRIGGDDQQSRDEDRKHSDNDR